MRNLTSHIHRGNYIRESNHQQLYYNCQKLIKIKINIYIIFFVSCTNIHITLINSIIWLVSDLVINTNYFSNIWNINKFNTTFIVNYLISSPTTPIFTYIFFNFEFLLLPCPIHILLFCWNHVHVLCFLWKYINKSHYA